MAYYEQQCTRAQQEAYHALLRGVTAVESAIRVPLLPMDELSGVFARLRLDHPEIFYLTSFRLRSAAGAEYGECLPEYLFEKAKILAHRQAISARVTRLTRDAKGKSEAEKVAFLHRFITENVRYDKLEKPYSHEVIGPLTQGVGVCEGIAKTVKLLADALQVECLVALSPPEEGKRYGHAWNLLRCGGSWYHFDATFDLSLSRPEETRWDYCLLSDAQIFRDHAKPLYPLPACSDGGRFYYKEKKLSFTKPDELFRRTAQSARKKPHFLFHWRGGYLTKSALEELTALLTAASAEAGKSAQIALNYPQSVFFVQFSDAPALQALTLENADEAGNLTEQEQKDEYASEESGTI